MKSPAAPAVSVVIDSYNYGRFVVDAVESVRLQTLPADASEVIVVDDGSTDDTVARLAPYGDAIRYVYKDNGGQASAFNVGIACARGEVIAFLDADDVWRSDKLERVVAAFRADASVDVVIHYMDIVDADRQVIGACPDAPIFFNPKPLAAYVAGNWPFFPPTSGIAVRKSCLQRLGPLPEEFKLCADLYLIAMLPFYAREVRLLQEPLGSYRIHGSNHWSGTIGIKNPGAMIDMVRSAADYVERAALRLGYDPSALRQSYGAIEAQHTIAQARQDGRMLEAMRRAWAMQSPGDSRSNSVTRRTMRACAAILPAGAVAWWRRQRGRRLAAHVRSE